jgi:hypothetical protein
MHRADRGRGPLHRAASPLDRFATGMSSLTHGTVVCSPLSSPSIKEVDGRSYHLVHHIFSLSRGKPSLCSPPASHRLRPPFINSSCIEFLHDLTLFLPRFLQLGVHSSGLHLGSQRHRLPSASESSPPRCSSPVAWSGCLLMCSFLCN